MPNPSIPGDQHPSELAVVRGGSGNAGQALTGPRKAFQRWVTRIATQRRELAEWRAFAEAFHAKVVKEYEPLRRKSRDLRIALLRRFDQIHDELGRREQARLARVILDDVSGLLAIEDDPALVALHDRYSDIGHEDLRRRQVDAMKSLVEEALGVAFNGELRSPHDVLAATRRWMAGESDAPAGQADRAEVGAHPRGAERDEPRSTRARARIAREEVMATGATQSIREAFRRLASALHPDRESDPNERRRKTTLMQRVNQAYKARDLMQLLDLQIETGQLDPTRLVEVGGRRLEHYNRVLKEQSESLRAEIATIILECAPDQPALGRRSPTPAALLDALSQDIAVLRRDCHSLSQDIEAFKDPRVMKAWLKSMRVSRDRRIDDDPLAALESLLSGREDRRRSPQSG